MSVVQAGKAVGALAYAEGVLGEVEPLVAELVF
jgi:hypothetical protein